MNVSIFWQLIEDTRNASQGDIGIQAGLLIEALQQFPVEAIDSYQSIMNALMDDAYTAALWDAASLIGCGCGDSGFDDFRAWLIAQGEEVYERALADPEYLADIVDIDQNTQDGGLLYVAIEAYERKTGVSMPAKKRIFPKLSGEHMTEAAAKARFPGLAARFGDCGRFRSLI